MIFSAIIYFFCALITEIRYLKKYKNADKQFNVETESNLFPDEDVLRHDLVLKESQNDEHIVKTINLCK